MEQEKIKDLEQLIEKDYGNTAGIVVLKNGELMYEHYFKDHTKEDTLHIYSVTKSILSILIGIAIDQGYIQSVEQKVLSFYPEYHPTTDDLASSKITIKDMLTMCAPYQYEEEPYMEYFTSDNWVKTALRYLGGKDDIGTFRYAPIIGPDILSGILVRSTGSSVLAFAREYLFTPLGITVKNSVVLHNEEEQAAFNQASRISGWVQDSLGVHSAGWGLTLHAMDMAKLGQLYLQKGTWKNSQIVSKHWVEESTKQHSYWKQQNLAYGYLWWLGEDNFSAMGDGGNVIYVNKDKQLVISILSMFVPNAVDRIDLIKQSIEPLFL